MNLRMDKADIGPVLVACAKGKDLDREMPEGWIPSMLSGEADCRTLLANILDNGGIYRVAPEAKPEPCPCVTGNLIHQAISIVGFKTFRWADKEGNERQSRNAADITDFDTASVVFEE